MAAAMLGAGESNAQVAPTGALIRLYEQPGGFVIGQEQRMYTTRFDAFRTRMIGVEVWLEHPAPAVVVPFDVACEMIRPDGAAVRSVWLIGISMRPGETRSVGANTMWARRDLESWPPGTYRVRCSGGALSLGEVTFQMTSNPPDVAGEDVRVAGVRFFPLANELTPLADRKYHMTIPFFAKDTQRIAIEVEFMHEPLGRAIEVPVDCFYFLPDGRTTPPISFTYQPEAASKGGYGANGWGWDQPGQWPRGQYTAVCMIHGRPVAVERFTVN